MDNTKTAIACGTAAVLALGLTGCGSNFEGSGNKDAASAEQLAVKTPDTWAQNLTVDANAKADQELNDGVYTGTGKGMAGNIGVTLLVQGNHISCINMTQDGESQSVGGYEAIRDGKFAEQIDAAQGSDIDGISGATITTAGVKAATEDALSQAQK